MTTSSMQTSVVGMALLVTCHAAIIVPLKCQRAAREQEEVVVPLPLTEAVEADGDEDEACSARADTDGGSTGQLKIMGSMISLNPDSTQSPTVTFLPPRQHTTVVFLLVGRPVTEDTPLVNPSAPSR
ncbi:hypothetical protein ACLOJK_023284, partial [Asimina triloba]